MGAAVKKISLFLLVLLIVSAIDSIRNLPSTAIFGSSMIFFFALGSIVFLFPVALVSAELATLFPEQGGPYHWMTAAFNDKVGMLAIWLQWINTMVWYPTILAFIAGAIAYLINPALIEMKAFLLIAIISIFWLLTLANLFGINVSAKINSFCGLIGTLVPLFLLILLGGIWILQGNQVHIQFTMRDIFPNLGNMESFLSLTTIIASFLGFELAGVHVNDIKNPQRNFPKAILYSVIILLASMLLGSLAIAVVTPQSEINMVAGIFQVFSNIFATFHIEWATPILSFLIIVGTMGGIINWLISPAKGLLHASQFGFLPQVFTKVNRYGVAYFILIAQATLVTLLCLTIYLVPNINSFYWFLTGLSTDLYIWMYVLMFLSAIKLRYKKQVKQGGFRIPYGNVGIWVTCLLGLFGCMLTFAVSFFPPSMFQISTLYYAGLILFGNMIMIIPVFLFYWYRGSLRKIKGI